MAKNKMAKDKMRVGSAEWKKLLREAVIAYCPELVSCKKCGIAILSGYQCLCGCDNPGDEVIDISDWI